MYGSWSKAKNERTIDLVVMGMRMGKGKYWGMCGSLRLGIGGIEVARCSGMDDDVREIITNDDIGRVVEVKYERMGSKGRLQHPRFMCWRDDKKASDCHFDQDPELETYYAGI
jgi:ATP-dependent DNA ligase